MEQNNSTKPAKRGRPSKSNHEVALDATKKNNKSTFDSFVNFVAKTGLGANPLLSQGTYQLDYSTRNRLFLESAYRSSWIVQALCNAPSEDATREGADFECSELSLNDHRILHTALEDFQIWDQITEWIRWSRLFGTCALIPLIEGHDMESPLNYDSITNGNFKGVMAVDRWRLLPSIGGGGTVTEFGPNLGLPKFYKTTSDVIGISDINIHYSRVFRMDGIKLPYYQWLAETSFGESLIEVLRDRLIAFDSITMGAAQLIFKAHLRTYKVDGLRSIVATNQDALAGLQATMDMIRAYQSNEGLTLMDADDEMEAMTYSFGGLSDVMLRFYEQLAGASGIPMVRLFGMEPNGMSSDGLSALNTYYDTVRRLQERHIRNPLRRILDCICRSELGRPLPDSFIIKFKPLYQLDENKKTDMASKISDSINTAFTSGLITQQQALRELSQMSNITGLYSTISEKEIGQADNEPPPTELDLMAEQAAMGMVEKEQSAKIAEESVEKEHDRQKDLNQEQAKEKANDKSKA